MQLHSCRSSLENDYTFGPFVFIACFAMMQRSLMAMIGLRYKDMFAIMKNNTLLGEPEVSFILQAAQRHIQQEEQPGREKIDEAEPESGPVCMLESQCYESYSPYSQPIFSA